MRCHILFYMATLAMCCTCAAQNVEIIDTVYTPVGYQDGHLSATIFLPDPSSSKGVAVILARYFNATRLTARVWCDTLAARGYLAMTIDYGNLDASPYPKPQRAFKTAVEFLRRNAGRFGLTENMIVGFGQSQGALIWGHTVIWDNDDVYFGTDPDVDDRLDAAVLLYGSYDNLKTTIPVQEQILTAHFNSDPSVRGTKGQPIVNAANVTTPILLIHGSKDDIVNVGQSRTFRDSLLAHGKTVKMIEFRDAGHTFDLRSDGKFTLLGLAAKDSALAFLEGTLKASTGAENRSAQIPAFHRLGQNFPNPFSASTTISVDLPHNTFVELTIVNVLGQEIETLVSENLPAGSYTYHWYAAGLPSGTYLYRLRAGLFAETKRLLLIQ